MPDNTQHSQQTDIDNTDLYLTTHNTHNRQTSTAQTYTWQHTTLTTDRNPQHGPIPDNTPHSQQTDVPSTDLYLTTHNTHNRQTSVAPAKLETPASGRPQTYVFVCAITGIGSQKYTVLKLVVSYTCIAN